MTLSAEGTCHCLGCFLEYDLVIFETIRQLRKLY